MPCTKDSKTCLRPVRTGCAFNDDCLEIFICCTISGERELEGIVMSSTSLRSRMAFRLLLRLSIAWLRTLLAGSYVNEHPSKGTAEYAPALRPLLPPACFSSLPAVRARHTGSPSKIGPSIACAVSLGEDPDTASSVSPPQNGSDVVFRGSHVFELTNFISGRQRLSPTSSNEALSSTRSFESVLIVDISSFF